MTSAQPVSGPATRAGDHVVNLDLSGRTAMVTGAASGIGRACAQRLAAAGGHVVAVDRDKAAVTALAAELAEAGLDATAEVVDLADLDAVDLLPAEIDVLVNNAGLQYVAPVPEFPAERFDHIQRVMVEAPFRLVRRVLPHMYQRGWGRVVNISSVHGLRASPFKSAYVTAKHAIEGLSKTVALEGAPHGVTSNCVNPGYVRTPLVEAQIAAQAAAHHIAESEVMEKIMLADTAIKRLLEADEIAELVAYLCSPVASFITGTSIVVDGGWTAH